MMFWIQHSNVWQPFVICVTQFTREANVRAFSCENHKIFVSQFLYYLDFISFYPKKHPGKTAKNESQMLSPAGAIFFLVLTIFTTSL